MAIGKHPLDNSHRLICHVSSSEGPESRYTVHTCPNADKLAIIWSLDKEKDFAVKCCAEGRDHLGMYRMVNYCKA
jgi:hypothetical protein